MCSAAASLERTGRTSAATWVRTRATACSPSSRAWTSRGRLAQRRGRLILDEAKARLQAPGWRRSPTKLRNGDLVETVQEFEAEADLIVIGKRGEAADFATLHLGSNLERVVRSSHEARAGRGARLQADHSAS